MNVKPMKKNVLIAENKGEVRSESGLILDGANSVRESKTGTVLAIGPEVTEVAVGDRVLLEWNKGAVVKVGEAQRVIIAEQYIVAVMQE